MRNLPGFVPALMLVVGVATADAAPRTLPFNVRAATGPLAGETATGTFTFDSSIIPAGGGTVTGLTLFTDFLFVWDGVQYNTSNTRTASLTFDRTGNLMNWSFGTTCLSSGCLVRLVPPGFQDWMITNSGSTSFL